MVNVALPERPSRPGRVFVWCRSHPFVALGVLLLAGIIVLLAAGWVAERDHRQRVRVSIALSRALELREALRVPVAQTNRLRASLLPLLGETSYRSESPEPEPDMPDSVAFRIVVDGFRLAFVFDPDQEQLSGQTLFAEYAIEGGEVRLRCWSVDIRLRYLPTACR